MMTVGQKDGDVMVKDVEPLRARVVSKSRVAVFDICRCFVKNFGKKEHKRRRKKNGDRVQLSEFGRSIRDSRFVSLSMFACSM